MVTVAEFLAAGAGRRPEPSGRWLHHQGIPGQAGAQHHFPHPEKHQNGVFLPYHRKSRPCIDRADPDFSGLHNKKRQILRLDVQYLVHLQGLEPWAH